MTSRSEAAPAARTSEPTPSLLFVCGSLHAIHDLWSNGYITTEIHQSRFAPLAKWRDELIGQLDARDAQPKGEPMTVGELIEVLSTMDPATPVFATEENAADQLPGPGPDGEATEYVAIDHLIWREGN